MLLKGRTAVISGAAGPRGIGLATAKLFAEHGARVAILDLPSTDPQAVASTIGPDHIGLACDVTDRGQCDTAAAEVIAQFGHIDALINNAGISQPLKLMDIDTANWTRVLDVNLAGVLHLSQAVVPRMRERKSGAIACMSSVSAQRGGGIFGGPHYAAAKAGVMGLAKAMARELGPDGIRVNCVAPGLVGTDITGDAITPAIEAKILEGIPLGRIGKPVDVARIFLFLASDLSSYTTGAVIDVNGGMLIH